VKDAISAVNDFTRVKMREDGIWRKILPPLTISNEELDRQVDTDKNVKVVDKQPESPGAINIPYQDIKEELPKRADIKMDDFLVLYCKTGERSAIACEIITNMNYTNVKNLIGGISAWKFEKETQ